MRAAQNSLVPTPATVSEEQRRWLRVGLDQPGGKLPLYDDYGNRISQSLIDSCLLNGWVEAWAGRPSGAPVRICRLTESGVSALQEKEAVIRVDFTQWKRDSSGENGLSLAPTPRMTDTVAPTTSGLLFQETASHRRL